MPTDPGSPEPALPDRCQRCHYPLGELPETAPCPECGSTLRDTAADSGLNGDALFCLICGAVATLLLLAWPYSGCISLFACICAFVLGPVARKRSKDRPGEGYRLAQIGMALAAFSTAVWIISIIIELI